MKIDETTEVSLSEIGLCLGLSQSVISELERAGVVIKASHGKYLLVKTLNNYKRHIKTGSSTMASDPDGNILDFNVERARKTKAEADRLERINRVETGEYVSLEEAKSDISEAVGVCSRILGNLKLNIARIAPQMPNRALDLIEKEQAKMLTALIELDESYTAKEVDTDSLAISK